MKLLFIWSILIPTFVCLVGFQSCKSENNQSDTESKEVKVENAVEVITEAMEFQMPDTIPSGWNIFRYKNLSPQTHFILIELYPEGKKLEDARKHVIPHFTEGMRLLNEGRDEEGFAAFGNLPDWFGEIKFLGGTGLISPDLTAETVLNLDPGYYLMECYVKMDNGVFHSSLGMISDFVVSAKGSGAEEPEADSHIEISDSLGIVFNDSIVQGKHTFSVYFKDQKVHENFVGHDINLVRIDEGTDLGDLEKWMNWVDPKGLIEPAPEGFTFLGGVNDMPEGYKGYFSADLEPGTYALISEVPNARSKNMLQTFVISD